MIVFEIRGIKIQFSFLFFALITIIVLLDPTGIALLSLLAALAHELGHIIAFLCLGQKPQLISFEFSGIRLRESYHHQTKFLPELVLLLAGSAVNLTAFGCFYLTGCWTAAAIHLCLGVYNLLPVHHLDGGKILSLLLSQFLPPAAGYHAVRAISYLCCAVLLFVGVRMALQLHFTLLIAGVYLVLMMVSEPD